MQVLKTISQHDCLSVFVITATPSVALKNVPGLRTSSTTDKQNSHESRRKGCHLLIFFDKWLAALYAGSSFFFVRSSGYNSLNSQSVYTQGGFMFTLPHAQKSNIDTQTCHRVDEYV